MGSGALGTAKLTLPYREPTQWSRETQCVGCEDSISLLQQFFWCDGMGVDPAACFTTVLCQLFDSLCAKPSINPMAQISKCVEASKTRVEWNANLVYPSSLGTTIHPPCSLCRRRLCKVSHVTERR